MTEEFDGEEKDKPAYKAGKKGCIPESKYDPAYIDHILEYFTVDKAYDIVTTTKAYYSDGTLKTEHSTIVPKPPRHIGAWCREIGVTRSTLANWEKKYPDFKEAVDKCRAMRREMIIDLALAGHYDAKFAEFASINMKDIAWKKEQTHNLQATDTNIMTAWMTRSSSLKPPENRAVLPNEPVQQLPEPDTEPEPPTV